METKMYVHTSMGLLKILMEKYWNHVSVPKFKIEMNSTSIVQGKYDRYLTFLIIILDVYYVKVIGNLGEEVIYILPSWAVFWVLPSMSLILAEEVLGINILYV